MVVVGGSGAGNIGFVVCCVVVVVIITLLLLVVDVAVVH